MAETKRLVVDFSLRRVFIFVVLSALKAAAWRERRADKTVTWTHVEDKHADKSQRGKKKKGGEKVKVILSLDRLFDTDGVPSNGVCVCVFCFFAYCVCITSSAKR